jgi:hypothetical protein
VVRALTYPLPLGRGIYTLSRRERAGVRILPR